MLRTLDTLLLGPALSASSRATLTGWMEATQTGLKKLRAGAPPGWRVADKTGSGDHQTSNDIAVLWPPADDPVLVAAYYTGGPATEDERSAVIAAVGRIAGAL